MPDILLEHTIRIKDSTATTNLQCYALTCNAFIFFSVLELDVWAGRGSGWSSQGPLHGALPPLTLHPYHFPGDTRLDLDLVLTQYAASS